MNSPAHSEIALPKLDALSGIADTDAGVFFPRWWRPLALGL